MYRLDRMRATGSGRCPAAAVTGGRSGPRGQPARLLTRARTGGFGSWDYLSEN